MKNLNEFVIEKLQLNPDSKITVRPQEPEGYDAKFDEKKYRGVHFRYKPYTKTGEKFQWFKWWEYLNDHGPTSKRDLLATFNLNFGYSTQFASLSKRRIIVPQKGKLVANSPEDWV